MSKQLKVLTQKNSQKFCENVKAKSLEAFKEMSKILGVRERTYSNAQCLKKIQGLFSNHPQLAKELNEYLDQSLKLRVKKTLTQEIEELFAYFKSKKATNMNIIFDTLRQFQEEGRQSGVQTAESEDNLKKKFLELFKNDEETYAKANDIFYGSQTKPKQTSEPPKKARQVDYFDDPKYRPTKRGQRQSVVEYVQLPHRPIAVPEVKSPQDDLDLILKLEKEWSATKYAKVAKIIFLFQHCIIGMNEIMDLVGGDLFQNQIEYEAFKEMIDTRELSRRRVCNPFRPLSDTDFSNSIRATFSYVQMPWCYPILCKGKTKQMRSVLNDKWVSVPNGSQTSNFCIRSKNMFQQLMLRSEDQRYEFDIYSHRLRMCIKMLDKVILKPDLSQAQIDKTLSHIVGMNVIQTIYKNTTKQQKQDLQRQLKHNLVNTCKILRQRISNQESVLRSFRGTYGIKAWMEVAEKNFVKSMDRKCWEFKRNERQNTKTQFFENEVEQKQKQLRKKQKYTVFHQDLEVFRILNSFESYSKREKCHSHQIRPEEVPSYKPKEFTNLSVLPILMLLFENKEVCALTYSFYNYYVNSNVPNDSEKSKYKRIASKFFEKILGSSYVVLSLPDKFKEEELNDILSKLSGFPSTVLPDIIAVESPGPSLLEQTRSLESPSQENKKMRVTDESDGDFHYLPVKSADSSIWFFSSTMHTTLRLIYSIYQRLLKAVQILYNYEHTRTFCGYVGDFKLNLFKLLFMANIKSKQNPKFQDNLTLLFGQSSYLFTTIYKLFQSLNKSLQTSFNDAFSSKLLQTVTMDPNSSLLSNQALYLLYVNKLSVYHSNSQNLFRVHFNESNKLLCINYFKSYYKSWDDGKEKKLEDKLEQVHRDVDFYVNQPVIEPESKNKLKKKDKKCNLGESVNRMEYFCFSSGLRLYSRVQFPDYFIQANRKQLNGNKQVRKQIKRACKTQQFLESLIIGDQ